MIAHDKSTEQVLEMLAVKQEVGLTEAEVNSRRAQYGVNKLKEKKKKTLWQRFFEQFKDVMILILIAAAVVSFVIACVEKNPKESLSLRSSY